MDKLENCAIQIINSLRAKKLFGENVDKEILENEVTRKIVEENIKYFTTTDQAILREFYEKTGVILAHKITDKRGTEYCFTMHGYRMKGNRDWCQDVQDEHVVVFHRELEDVDLSKSKEIEFTGDVFDLNYALTVETLAEPRENRLDRQKEFLMMTRPNEDFVSEGLKQIVQNTFGEIFLLYKDGKLLREGKEYAKNVEKIVRLGSGTKYIIYKDNSVESIETYRYPGGFRDGFDRVVASEENSFVALLKNGELEVMTTGDGSNGYATHYFSGVEDIEFEENSELGDEAYGDLLIKSGGAIIKMKFEEYDAPWFVGV